MPYASLAEFLEELTRQGELARVAVEVDAAGELTEIAGRLLRQAGPAVLFSQVQGSRLPVAANLLATESRMCRALDVASLSEISKRLSEPPSATTSAGWMDALRLVPAGGNGHRLEPKQIKNAPSQQVVRLASDVDLSELPMLHCAAPPAAAVVLTQAYDRGERGMEVCHLRLTERNQIALAWQPTGSLHRLALDHQRRGQPMPLAILLGGHPLDWFAALAPQPLAGDPWLLAGALRGRPLEVARLRTLDLDAPADAEIVLEGVLDTRQSMVEGTADVGITAITHRANPVVVAMLAGEPPHELSVLTAAVQRIFLPRLRQLLPEVIDLAFPKFSGGRIAIVAIQKAYAGQAQKVANLLWGLGAWADVRVLIVVDEDIDVHDELQAGRLLAGADFERDLFVYRGPASALDRYHGRRAIKAKWGVDATRPLSGEPIDERGAVVKPDAAAALVERRWREYGLPLPD